MARIFRKCTVPILSLIVTAIVISGCANASNPAGSGTAYPQQAAAAIAATPTVDEGGVPTDPRERWGIDEFVIVLLPGEDTPEVAWTREIFGEALSEALYGLPVREFHATSFAAVVEAMRFGHAHLAFFGPFSYVTAAERAGAEVFAVVGFPDPYNEGEYTHGYYSHFITHVDSGIYTLGDLPGRTFGFVDPESTSGNIVPLNEFVNYFADERPDLQPDDLHISGRFFSTSMFTGTHANSIQGVARGDIDAGVVSSNILTTEIRNGLVDPDQIRIFHSSPRIPGSPQALQRDLPEDLKEIVINFYLNWDDEEFWAIRGARPGSRHIPATDCEFDVIRELRERFGLDD